LLKHIQIALRKIGGYEKSLLKDLKVLLEEDKAKVMEEYRKELKLFRNI
jgi:hypothetical protein